MLRTINDPKELDRNLLWIKAEGGVSESLILSGLLHEINANGGKKFGIFRQMPFSMMLFGHPAVAQFGIPPEDFKIVSTTYLPGETPGAGDNRPYNFMSRKIEGRNTGKEKLWVNIQEDVAKTIQFFSVKDGAVFISTGREHTGKIWDLNKWNTLVQMLEKHTGKPVIQIGGVQDEHVTGAFDRRGKAGIKQTLALIKEKASAVICVDSFPLIAAKLAEKPAVVLWGSNERAAYGYDDHINLENPSDMSDNMSAIPVEQVFEEAKKTLRK